MKVEEKLNVLIKGQTAILTALANVGTGSTTDLTPALAAIQAVSDKIDSEVGTDSTGTTPPVTTPDTPPAPPAAG